MMEFCDNFSEKSKTLFLLKMDQTNENYIGIMEILSMSPDPRHIFFKHKIEKKHVVSVRFRLSTSHSNQFSKAFYRTKEMKIQ